MTTLRPVSPSDDVFLDSLNRPANAGPFNTFDRLASDHGPHTPGEIGRLVVWDRSTRIGSVSWFGVPYGPNQQSVAQKIGITIHPDHRRRGHGSEAQRLLAAHLFETTQTNRVEADTDVENVAEQKALERAGFVREGVVRGAQYRAGEYHDVVLFSMLRPG